jgi:NADPH-dependent glutamate synthase beta subunit-like oxidoreductase
MNKFTHHNVHSVKEAVKLLAKNKGTAKVTAGGTDLLGTLKDQLLPDYPNTVINIKTISGMSYIKEEKEGLIIGALSKLSEIANSPVVREKYKILSEAARSVATPQIRNMATIGGNLAQEVRCWYYRYPQQIGGPILCLRKGGKICNALFGDNRYHSIFGGAHPTVYPCTSYCPSQIDIPSYLSEVRGGHRTQAAKILLGVNPMPAITGRVCPIFCEPECNRKAFDEPVAIRCIERSLGDHILERRNEFFIAPETKSGRKIAIVGSGPAGLAAAYYLRSLGHSVTIFEKLSEPGGMLLYSIPPYRLPKDVVKRQIQALKGMGIAFKVGVNVGKDIKVTELMDRFDAVFLACGSWKEKPLGIKGEHLTLSGLGFLNKVNKGERNIPGRKVAVIGGGNVAMDVARTLLRLGVEPVVIYRRSQDEMPALRDEVKKAREEGIEFQFLTLPKQASKTKDAIKLTCVRMRLGAPDASGRPKPFPIKGSDFTTTFDAVVNAVGEEPDTTLVPAKFLKKGPKEGHLGKNLFAGGDFARGPSTVVQAIAAGRKGADLINLFLKGDSQHVQEAEREKSYSRPFFESTPRISIPTLPVQERIRSIDMEDMPDLSAREIEKEAGRCFNCGCLAVNPSDIAIALVALDAQIVTTKRTVPVQSFFTARTEGSTVLNSDELITEIWIPKPPRGSRQNYEKFTLRKPVDFAIVNVASLINIQDGICTDARIAIGAVGPEPVRARAAEEIIIGQPIDEAVALRAAEEAMATTQPLSMNKYKVEIAKVLIKRAIMGSLR